MEHSESSVPDVVIKQSMACSAARSVALAAFCCKKMSTARSLLAGPTPTTVGQQSTLASFSSTTR
jgi:hypothetical protein